MHYVFCAQLERFYANVLRPTMEGKPFVVIRDGWVLDTCETAASLGIVRGMPMRTARTLLEGGTVVKWKEEEFREAQRSWLDVCVPFTGVIEPADGHIAYLDLSKHPQPNDIAARIAQELEQATGLWIQWGVGRSKWMAHLAMIRGDKSLALADPEEFLRPLPVDLLTPIDDDHRARLRFLGYRTIGEVAKIPLEVLKFQFEQEALRIHQAAKGALQDPVQALYPPESVTAELSFEGAVALAEPIEEGLKELARTLAHRLAVRERQGSDLTLFVEFEDGEILTLARKFSKPIRCYKTALAALRLLAGANLESVFPPLPSAPRSSGAKRLHALLPHLERIPRIQNDLLGRTPKEERDASAASAFKYIRTVFGDEAIQSGHEISIPRRKRVLSAWKDATGWN